jgi:hypothetical protein
VRQFVNRIVVFAAQVALFAVAAASTDGLKW